MTREAFDSSARPAEDGASRDLPLRLSLSRLLLSRVSLRVYAADDRTMSGAAFLQQ